MEDIDSFNDFSFRTELEKGFDIDCWDFKDVCGFLEITEEELEYFIKKTGKEAAKIGWKTSYNINFISSYETIITTVGMYQLIKLNSDKELKRYENHFLEMAVSDLIRYQGHKQRSSKRKNKNPNYDFEKKGEYELKNYDSSLRIPNLEIEDRSHIFYNEHIVITGNFENFQERKDMAELIKSVGGVNRSGITGKTKYLIVGKSPGPSKTKKAKELGITTLNEDEFIKLFK